RAISRPSPLEAPVIRTTLSCSSIGACTSFVPPVWGIGGGGHADRADRRDLSLRAGGADFATCPPARCPPVHDRARCQPAAVALPRFWPTTRLSGRLGGAARRAMPRSRTV